MKKFVIVKRDCRKKIKELQDRGQKIPLLVEIAIRILYQQEKIFFGIVKVTLLHIIKFILIFQRKQVVWVRKMVKSVGP